MRNVALTTLIGLLMGGAAQAQTDAPPDLPADAGASPQTPANNAPAASADEPPSVPDFDEAALALADQTEVRDVDTVEVRVERSVALTLMFDPEHALDERIAMEQFAV